MPKRKSLPQKKRTSDLGEYLTRIRQEQGKTLQEIADAVGKSKSYICRIERGQRERKTVPQNAPRDFVLYQLAEVYKADIAQVLEIANCPQLLLLYTTEEERQELIRHLNEIRQQENKGC